MALSWGRRENTCRSRKAWTSGQRRMIPKRKNLI